MNPASCPGLVQRQPAELVGDTSLKVLGDELQVTGSLPGAPAPGAGASNGQAASTMNISGHTVAGSLRSMLSRAKPATGPSGPAAPRRPGFAHPHLATAG